MDIQRINQYKITFDSIEHEIIDDNGKPIEVWYARELQALLGYARWENFVVAINRAIESCNSQDIRVDDHFREVTKMVSFYCLITEYFATASPIDMTYYYLFGLFKSFFCSLSICLILLSGVGKSSGIVPPRSLIVSRTFLPTAK